MTARRRYRIVDLRETDTKATHVKIDLRKLNILYGFEFCCVEDATVMSAAQAIEVIAWIEHHCVSATDGTWNLAAEEVP